jgi:hypothetical protein
MIQKNETIAAVALIAIATVGVTSSIGMFLQHVNAAKANDNGATVAKGFSCGYTISGIQYHTTETHAVATPGGQTHIFCHS